jgi:hypothetical protein
MSSLIDGAQQEGKRAKLERQYERHEDHIERAVPVAPAVAKEPALKATPDMCAYCFGKQPHASSYAVCAILQGVKLLYILQHCIQAQGTCTLLAVVSTDCYCICLLLAS